MRSAMTETLLVIGKAALAGYVLIAGLAYVMQDRLLFFPQPLAAGDLRAIAARYPRAEEIRLPVEEGITLHGWYLKPMEAAAPRTPVLIYFGGNAEEVSWLLGQAPRFAGYSLALMNYRGYGGSGGRPSEAALYSDALRIYDHAIARADVDAARVVLMGRSLGTAMAVHVAARRSATAVLLVSPFDSVLDLGRRHYPILPVSWLLRHRFDAKIDAGRIHAPVFVLTAANDSIIPRPHSRALYEAWRGPKAWREIQGADHNDVSDSPAYWQEIGEFLEQARRK